MRPPHEPRARIRPAVGVDLIPLATEAIQPLDQIRLIGAVIGGAQQAGKPALPHPHTVDLQGCLKGCRAAPMIFGLIPHALSVPQQKPMCAGC